LNRFRLVAGFGFGFKRFGLWFRGIIILGPQRAFSRFRHRRWRFIGVFAVLLRHERGVLRQDVLSFDARQLFGGIVVLIQSAFVRLSGFALCFRFFFGTENRCHDRLWFDLGFYLSLGFGIRSHVT